MSSKKGPLSETILDEIALEGLEGITLEGLWIRLSVNLGLELPLRESFQKNIWTFILNSSSVLSFYELPEARSKFQFYDRTKYFDGNLEKILKNESFVCNIYKYNPIDKDGVRGSCEFYNERKIIPVNEIKGLSEIEVEKRWGNKFVIVASQTLREKALFLSNTEKPNLFLLHYCVLEMIGRSRYNGELTSGNNSLLSFFKDSALIFYVRSKLLQKGLITKQTIRENIKGRFLLANIIHLTRFFVEIKSKHTQIYELLANILKNQPNNMLSSVEIKNHIGPEYHTIFKKAINTETFRTYFDYDKLPYRTVYPNSSEKEWKLKNKPNEEKEIMTVRLKDPNLIIEDIQIKESEVIKDYDEDQDFLDIKNQYIDMPLSDQIYKLIEKRGTEGCSITDISQHLGLRRYQVRKIINDLCKNKFISLYMKDRGKQRAWTYVTNANAKAHGEKICTPNAGDLIKSLRINTTKPELITYMTNQKQNIVNTDDQENTIESILNEIDKEGSNEMETEHISSQKKEQTITTKNNEEENSNLEKLLISKQEHDKKENHKIKKLEKCEKIITCSEVIKTWSKLKCDENIFNSDELSSSRENLKDLPHMKIKITQVKRYAKIDIKSSLTQRQIERTNLIVNTINEKLIIDAIQILRLIKNNEKDLGYQEKCCRKSLIRSINWLNENNIIKYYEIIFQINEYTKIEKFLCHNSITIDNINLNNEIKRIGNSFYIYVAEKYFNTKLIEKSISSLNKIIDKVKLDNNSNDNIIQQQQQKQHQQQQQNIIKNYKKGPRFIRIRHFHELLFYLVYDQKNNNLQKKSIKLNENIINKWLELYPDLNIKKFEKYIPELYSYNNIDYKMFLKPLPNYDKIKSNGWCYLDDILQRLPLSIIVQMFLLDDKIDKNSELFEFINHPILQHIPITLLPINLQVKLGINKLLNSTHYDDVLKILNLMGLIQIGHKNLTEIKKIWIYVNHYATLLDTTISDEEYDQITKTKDYDEIRFKFFSLYDIEQYWNKLYQICLITKLGFRIAKKNKIIRREISELPTVSFNDAENNDKGFLPGDRFGAAGLDTALYAHIRKNWAKLSGKINNQTTITLSSTIAQQNAANKIRLRLNQVAFKVTTRDRRIATIKKKTNFISTSDLVTKNKRLKFKKNILPINKKLIKLKKSKKIYREYDAVDLQALKRMQKLRTSWNLQEDEILLFCRAVLTYFQHPFIHRVINPYTIRDILHWSCGNISSNKTSVACQRRLSNLVKIKKKSRTDISSWVFELRQSKFINQRFGHNFLRDLRKIYSDDDVGYGLAMRIHFIQMVYYLRRIIKNCSDINNEQQYIILPSTINQFKILYKEIPPAVGNDEIRYYDPQTIDDIEISTINLVIHSSVCCSKDKTLYNVQLFDIYKTYKEETLAKAFKQAKNDQLIIQQKKRNAVSSKSASSSTYSLSNRYKLQLLLKIPHNCFDEYYEILYESFSKLFNDNNDEHDASCVENSFKNKFIEFSSVNSGGLFYLIDLINRDSFNLDIQLPKKVLTIDPQQSSCGESEKILDHFRKMFENAPKVDYSKILESTLSSGSGNIGDNLIQNELNINKISGNNHGELSSSSSSLFAQRKIKFSLTDVTYSLSYNPYDIIMKLTDEYLHFFCALSNLNHIIDLNFAKCFNSNYTITLNCCPFNGCILEFENYINEIENIVKNNKDTINILARYNENDDDDDNNIKNIQLMYGKFLITTENLMQIFLKFQRIYKNKNEKYDKKDIGKKKSQNIIDMISLTKDLLEYQDNNNVEDVIKSCEYEATLNKEEKIVRMQDVFVVNIPKLRLSFDPKNNNYNDNVKSIIIHNGLKLPGYLKKLCSRFDTVLEQLTKDAIWPTGTINLETELMKSNLTSNEKEIIKEILQFISKCQLGATSTMLREKYQDENLLTKCINILRHCGLVMRTGIEQWTYVHRDHIRPWVIHSYHIKRLEKESIGSKSNIDSLKEFEKRKRKFKKSENNDMNNDVESEPPPDKKLKTNNLEECCDSSNESKPQSSSTNREIIILRPFPWIRVNGSLNRRVLDKWLGSILLECINMCGLPVKKLFIRFNYLHPVCILYLLEVLQKLDCVKLKKFNKKKLNLFSTYEEIDECNATEFSNLDNVFIVAEQYAVNNLTLFIGEKKYKTDFV